MTSLKDDTESDVITLRGCDKKSIIDIQKELNDRINELNNGKNKEHNRRMFLIKWVPTL